MQGVCFTAGCPNITKSAMARILGPNPLYDRREQMRQLYLKNQEARIMYQRNYRVEHAGPTRVAPIPESKERDGVYLFYKKKNPRLE